MQRSPSAPPVDAAATAAVAMTPWWGRFSIPEGQGGSWEVGPLMLSVQRKAREWRVSWDSDDSGDESVGRRSRVRCPVAASDLHAGSRVARFAVQGTTEELVVEPVLPDRAVVARPELPLTLLGDEEVALYVAIPLCLRLRVAGDRELLEVPVKRLQETWFGPSTLVGELCYATRTSARLELGDLPPGPHRAICRVALCNGASTPLAVERLSLPVHHLDLWWHEERGLWARGLQVERTADGRMASLRFAEGPPEAVRGAERVGAARQGEPKLALVRALEALLG